MATKKAAKKPSEAQELKAKIAKALGASEEEAELRALRELAGSLGVGESKAPPRVETKKEHEKAQHTTPGSYLPQRLYLAMDGRGLDGRGMPQEVIDLPCIIGSSKKQVTVWINSPQIETQHLRITHGDEGWVLEDLGSEHGTFMGDKRIKRRVLQDGDEFHLAGYLRLRTDLK
jgi:pSer/pThr/pTyr-binding forkhead associated (FHA) protein